MKPVLISKAGVDSKDYIIQFESLFGSEKGKSKIVILKLSTCRLTQETADVKSMIA